MVYERTHTSRDTYAPTYVLGWNGVGAFFMAQIPFKCMSSTTGGFYQAVQWLLATWDSCKRTTLILTSHNRHFTNQPWLVGGLKYV